MSRSATRKRVRLARRDRDIKAVQAGRQAFAASDAPRRMKAEPPSRVMDAPTLEYENVGASVDIVIHWRNSHYYGVLRKFAAGSPFGGGRYAVLSVTALDESSRHDWRDFQQLKNLLLGPEWEGVELYPAEGRLIDSSNRFYLWCFPGPVPWGLPDAIGRRVWQAVPGRDPQRPFPPGVRCDLPPEPRD